MIGYYVHHQGAGHLRRMQGVAAHLGQPVTVLSSLARPAGHRGDWVRLAPDDRQPAPEDVTAGGTLHWVPRHDPGIARRAAQIVDWVVRARPSLVVVDVSVEVAVLVRLAGVPVVVAAMQGDRTDRPHATAYDLAEALLAPWPDTAPTDWPRHWLDKTCHVGAFSRFDGRLRTAPGPGDRPTRRALLLWGEGGPGHDPTELDRMRAATPGWTWQLAHPGQRLDADELWRALCAADVVVAHAGQNAVAEVAAARVPAVVVADPRPFDEQQYTARALRAGGIAVGLDAWPAADRWPALLADAVALGGDGWRSWSYGDGARRAARALDELAARLDPGVDAGLGLPTVTPLSPLSPAVLSLPGGPDVPAVLGVRGR